MREVHFFFERNLMVFLAFLGVFHDFKSRVSVKTVVKKGIRVRVRPKLRGWAEFGPKFRLNLVLF